jgi:hypothetical protein
LQVLRFFVRYTLGKGGKEGKPVPFDLEFNLHTYTKMAGFAQGEGRAYGNIHERRVSGEDLEGEFSFISKRFVKKDLFYGLASVFDWSFTPDQKRLIYYLLSQMSRSHLRRSRKLRAANEPM